MEITVEKHPILSFYLSLAYIIGNIYLFWVFPIINFLDFIERLPMIFILVVVFLAFILSCKELLKQWMDIAGW